MSTHTAAPGPNLTQAYVEQQQRSKSAVISEIVLFSVLVLALSTTAILTRSRAVHQTDAGGTGGADPVVSIATGLAPFVAARLL